ncbi:toxin VasX [Vibrio gazogenes]|uniref:Toxin VasX N-terminal region domain-containing protein n=1 Tax=Vibrio gazogenes TaxID=687 RepID=A0A1Z2SEM4_VIBGA|nr:toxin VasX [Vibrio gazogenes]ASA55636.1 hypothetical protein BSQ33_07950 [Vibrio gazogenes]
MACTCDHNKLLLIEVTGTQHEPQQDFAFYDLTDMTQQSALEGKKYTDKALAETTIYGWDWCKEKENRNVWLSVKASDGPIMLPLFDNVSYTQRIAKGPQKYQLHSFIPLTLLPTFKEHATPEERIAPLRDGYLYIAYNGKIWREIQISATDDGKPCFKDTNLFAYRQGRDKPVKTETKREVTGEALKEIWYPAKENGRKTNIRMAFSEVQWSGARINRLEANPSELNQRMEKIEENSEQIRVIRAEAKKQEKPLPEMREREMAIEVLLGEPRLFSRDLAGSWLKSSYESTKSEIENARKDGSIALSQYRNRIQNTQDEHLYDMMLRQTALSEIIGAETKESVKIPSWNIDSVSDYLTDAKKRFLRGIVLTDPLFELRHLSYLIKSGVSEIGMLLKDASIQPYFKSAELVQRFFVPKKWGKTENPYHDFIDTRHFDSSPGGLFRRTMRLTERMLCFNNVQTLQKQLASHLKAESLVTVLKDITSLDDTNAGGVYPLIGNAISALSLQIGAIDTLGYGEEGHDNPNPNLPQLEQLLSNDRTHPLHELLFTENGQVTLDGEYTPPKGKNDGSGLCTAENIARWADKNLLVKPDKIEVAELNSLFPSDIDTFPTARRIAGVVDGMMRDYFIAVAEIMRGLAHASTSSVNFETVYVPLLSTLKSIGPTALGKIELTDIDKVKAGYLVIGVEGQGLKMGITDADREFLAKQKGRNPFRRVYDSNGKLVLTTNKKTADAALKQVTTETAESPALHPKGKFKVVVVPDEADGIGAIYSKPATKRTIKDFAKSKSIAEAYEKFRVPHFMVVIEVMNLLITYKNLDKNIQEGKHIAYVGINMFSALADLSVASAHSANMLLGMESTFTKAVNTPLFNFTDDAAIFLKEAGLKTIYSRLFVASTAAGLLTAGIAIYDSFQLWDKHDDDAATAMMAVGVGTAMAAIGAIAAEGTFLSALGPWGIAIAVIGGIFYMFLIDTPYETWLKNGPFSTDPDNDYAHLQDPETAFQRLLGLLIRFEVNLYEIQKQVRLSEQEKAEWQQAGVTHILWVRSNLGQLLNQEKETSLMYVRQAIMEHKSHLVDTASRTEYVYTHTLIDIDKHNTQPMKRESTADGDLYGYQFSKSVPKDRTDNGFLYSKRDIYRYEPGFLARAQFVINDVTFPTPALDDSASSPKPGHGLLPTFKMDEDEDKAWLRYQLPEVKEESQ